MILAGVCDSIRQIVLDMSPLNAFIRELFSPEARLDAGERICPPVRGGATRWTAEFCVWKVPRFSPDLGIHPRKRRMGDRYSAIRRPSSAVSCDRVGARMSGRDRGKHIYKHTLGKVYD